MYQVEWPKLRADPIRHNPVARFLQRHTIPSNYQQIIRFDMAKKKTTTAKKKTKTVAKVAAPKKKASGAKTKAAAKTKATAKPAKKRSAARRSVKATTATPVAIGDPFVETQKLAYSLAEKDGFSRSPVDYWLGAEAQLRSA